MQSSHVRQNNNLHSPVCELQATNSKSPKTAELNKISQMYETLRSLLSKWVEVGSAAGEMLCKKGCFSTDDMVDNTAYTRQEWKNVCKKKRTGN